jgi:CheY-like chemotaxis protein
VRVLLVDDQALVRQAVAFRLDEWGARVTFVPGIAEALEAPARERPNVVLSDIQMPGEDGYALIRRVRALPAERGGRTPAAALTGLSGVEDRARVLQAGVPGPPGQAGGRAPARGCRDHPGRRRLSRRRTPRGIAGPADRRLG